MPAAATGRHAANEPEDPNDPEREPERDPLADEPDVEPGEGPEGKETDIPAGGEPGEDHAVEGDERGEQEVPF